MPNFRLPRSRSVMLPPDYNFENMYAGRARISAQAGLPFAAGVFNSSTAGQVLIIYGWTVATASPTPLNFDLVLGNQVGGLNLANPLYPLQPAGPGIMNAFLTAFNPTPTAGGWEIGAEPAHWPYPWPAAIVAPGYTWQMVSQINTGFLDAALFWLVSSLA